MLNAIGLALAVACCIVGFYSMDFITGFDKNHKNGNTLYRVASVYELNGAEHISSYTPLPLIELVKFNVGHVSKSVRFKFFKKSFLKGGDLFPVDLAFVDSDFFDMFSFDFIQGNSKSLTDKKKIFVSEKLAKRLFGTDQVVGRAVSQLTQTNFIREFEIAGVFLSPPTNSSLAFDACTNYNNSWEEAPILEEGKNWRQGAELFVEIRNPEEIPICESQISQFAKYHNDIQPDRIIKRFELDPFEGMAVRDRLRGIRGIFTRQAPPLALYIGTTALSAFVLFVVCFNLVNSSIINSLQRFKEVGIRKALGCSKRQLFVKLLSEWSPIFILSIILGLLLAYFFLIPFYNELWPDSKLHLRFSVWLALFLMGLFTLLSLLPVVFSLVYLGRYKVSEILSNKIGFAGTPRFPQVVLSVQLVISLIVVVACLSFISNASYQKKIDLGFDEKGGIYLWVNTYSEYETYRTSLIQNKDISTVTASKDHLFISTYTNAIKHENVSVDVKMMDVGDDYLKATGLTLLEGRDFINGSETDKRESAIITEGLMKYLNWQTAAEKEIIWRDSVKLTVIGVVKDIYNHGFWKNSDMMLLRYTTPKEFPFVIVSASPEKLQEVNRFMQEKWKEHFPDRFYPGRYLNDEITKAETTNDNMVKIFMFIGVVTILLSSMGIINLFSLLINQRTREIGIRRALGASSREILWTMNYRFIVTIFIALLAGMLIGKSLSNFLMGSFFYFFKPVEAGTLFISAIILAASLFICLLWKYQKLERMKVVDCIKNQ